MVLALTTVWTSPGPAGADSRRNELARQSILAARRTASTPPTPELVIEKVNQACRLLEKEGEAAFPAFQGADSPFIFNGTYIFIHTLRDSRMHMHPVNPSLEGKQWLYQRDVKGKLYFAEFNEAALKKNGGWVRYYWPKPGESQPLPKITYVKRCVHKGVEYVVACGIYLDSHKEPLSPEHPIHADEQP